MTTNEQTAGQLGSLAEALAVSAVASSNHPCEAATALITAAALILDRDFGPTVASALMIDAIAKSRDEWARRHAN